MTTVACDAEGRAIPGTERTEEADTLCASYGFVPAVQLTRALGCEHRYAEKWGGWIPVQGDDMATSADNFFESITNLPARVRTVHRPRTENNHYWLWFHAFFMTVRSGEPCTGPVGHEAGENLERHVAVLQNGVVETLEVEAFA